MKIPTYHEMCERKLTLYICREIEKDVGKGVNIFLERVKRGMERAERQAKIRKKRK